MISDKYTEPILFGRSAVSWFGILVALLILILTLTMWNVNDKWQIALNLFLVGMLFGNFLMEGFVIIFRKLTDRTLKGWRETTKMLEEETERHIQDMKELNERFEDVIRTRKNEDKDKRKRKLRN